MDDIAKRLLIPGYGVKKRVDARKKILGNVRDLEQEGRAVLLRQATGSDYYAVILEGDKIRVGQRLISVAGSRTTVDSAGSIQKQFSPARLAAFGILASSKKVDNREVFLTIEGVDGSLAVAIRPDDQAKARAFAAKLNQLARQQEARSSSEIPEQIAALAKLCDQGVLTAEEFQSKKAELLGRL